MNENLSMNKNVHLSPLVLADQMITLAQAADRAGYSVAASRLIHLAFAVLEPGEASHGRSRMAGL